MMRIVTIVIIMAALCGQAFAAVDDAETVSLLHFDGGITDESGLSWTPSDAATITSSTKFGVGALDLPSPGGTIQSAAAVSLGSENFTVDFWGKIPMAGGGILAVGAYNDGLQIQTAPGTFYIWVNGGYFTADYPSDGAFHHYAMVRSSGIVTMYIDGVGIASSTMNSSLGTNKAIVVGTNAHAPSQFICPAQIDELRISKVARWTANFTPPTLAYGPVTVEPFRGISLAQGGKIRIWSQIALPEYLSSLLHFDYSSGWLVDPAGRTWITSGTYVSSSVGTYKFGSGTALALDFKPTWLKTSFNDAVHPGSSDFCVDFWVFWGAARDQASNKYILYSQTQDLSNYFQLYHTSSLFGMDLVVGGALKNEYVSDDISSSSSWHHYEFSRTASVTRFFVDGVEKSKTVGSPIAGATFPTMGGADIYAFNSPTYTPNQTGWFIIDEFRFQKGGGGHTSGFSVPVSPYSIETHLPMTGRIAFTTR